MQWILDREVSSTRSRECGRREGVLAREDQPQFPVVVIAIRYESPILRRSQFASVRSWSSRWAGPFERQHTPLHCCARFLR